MATAKNWTPTFFQPTIVLALTLMSVFAMMIIPMPAWLLDFGLAASFALAILIFTVVLFIERPLDFSVFPTILLATLVLRLSLNVSSTKLIIGEGHTGTSAAGNVIEGFAMFVMGGSVVLGVIIFCVLLIVNFMVITKGATRMAEVSARFALDGMPGKQLAIDSDVAAGSIDHEEAKARRKVEQDETTFFGSLDGASKFVKGDAVAGLLITLLNLVVGLLVGITAHGMQFSDALETYSILTVGDGLVTQIPAVIVSIASALLLARGGATGATDLRVVEQLGRHPEALGTVAVLMFLFGLVPGLPFVPFLLGSCGLGVAAYLAYRSKSAEALQEAVDQPVEAEAAPKLTIGDILDVDEIHVEFSADLVPMVIDPATGLDARIDNMRRHVAQTFGVILPEIRLTDNSSFPQSTYAVRIQGVEQERAKLETGKVLALVGEDRDDLPPGTDVQEPVYGAPARWIDTSQQEAAALAGATVVGPAEVLATHLLEVIKRNFSKLLTLKSLREHLDELSSLTNATRSAANKELFNELIPDKVPMEVLLSVLRLLVEEQISVRNLPGILEAVAEARPTLNSPEALCEHVRQRLGHQLVASYRREDGVLPLIQLAPEWEETFQRYQMDHGNDAGQVALPPEDFNRLAEQAEQEVSRSLANGAQPTIVTTSRRRRLVRTILTAKGVSTPVMSFEEIGTDVKPALVGTIAA